MSKIIFQEMNIFSQETQKSKKILETMQYACSGNYGKHRGKIQKVFIRKDR